MNDGEVSQIECINPQRSAVIVGPQWEQLAFSGDSWPSVGIVVL